MWGTSTKISSSGSHLTKLLLFKILLLKNCLKFSKKYRASYQGSGGRKRVMVLERGKKEENGGDQVDVS